MTTDRRSPSRRSIGGLLALVWGSAMGYLVIQAAVAARFAHERFSPGAELLGSIVSLGLWGIASPVILWSTGKLPLTRRRWLVSTLVHLAGAATFILGINLIGPLATQLLLGRPVEFRVLWDEGLLVMVQVGHLAAIVYAFIAGIGYYVRAVDARRAESLRTERLQAALTQAQLRALQLQLEPHFLFNTLNSIGSLILTGRHSEAFDTVGQLGDLLRSVLATESQVEVSVREEVDLAEAYLCIEQIRLGDRLRVRWEIDPATLSGLIPPLLIQPLAENAIRHGISRQPHGGEVVVRLTRRDRRVYLEVADNGPGPPPAGPETGASGIGLDNANRRLQELYGPPHRLTLERVDGWTKVSVELPYRTDPTVRPSLVA